MWEMPHLCPFSSLHFEDQPIYRPNEVGIKVTLDAARNEKARQIICDLGSRNKEATCQLSKLALRLRPGPHGRSIDYICLEFTNPIRAFSSDTQVEQDVHHNDPHSYADQALGLNSVY